MKKGNKTNQIIKNINKYYSGRINKYGPNHKGVDWNSESSQILRFEQLLKIGNIKNSTYLDYGCGYGALNKYLKLKEYGGEYIGYDISKEMIKIGKKMNRLDSSTKFVTKLNEKCKSDYVIASGIFNVKKEVSDKDWKEYVIEILDELAKYSKKGFSFNMLTKYSDKDKMREDLYYADPYYFMDYCIKHYSRHVAVLHNYGLYEFTLLVNYQSKP